MASDMARACAPHGDRLPAAGAPPLVDRARLDDVVGADHEARAMLVAQFLTLARGTVAELAAAVEAGEPAAVRWLAHRLKGSAAIVGAERLARIAGQLSDAGGAARLAHARSLHAGLQSVLELTERAFRGVASPQASR